MPTQLRLFPRSGRSGPIHDCFVCGDPYTGSRIVTLWPLCPIHGTNARRGAIIRLVSEARQQSHLRTVRNKRGQAEPTYSNPIWRKRKAHRHLQQGSYIHRLVLESVEKGWPLWDLLPPEIQDWVIDHNCAETEQMTCEECGGSFPRRRGANRFCSQSCHLACLNRGKRR